MRVGRANDGDVEEPRELQVGGVLRRARHLLEAVDAGDVRADGTCGGHAVTSSRAAGFPASMSTSGLELAVVLISAAAACTASTIWR